MDQGGSSPAMDDLDEFGMSAVRTVREATIVPEAAPRDPQQGQGYMVSVQVRRSAGVLTPLTPRERGELMLARSSARPGQPEIRPRLWVTEHGPTLRNPWLREFPPFTGG